jgi:hypothetical protein
MTHLTVKGCRACRVVAITISAPQRPAADRPLIGGSAMELLGTRVPLRLSTVPFGRKPVPHLIRLGPGPHAVPPRPS